MKMFADLKRKLLPVAIAGMVLAFPAINASATSYELIPDATNFSLGDSFDVLVSVKDPFAGNYIQDELLGFGFNYDFNHSILSLSSIAVDSLNWADLTGVFADAMVAGMAFPSITNQGQNSVPLAKLSFKVIGLGNSQINVSSQFDSEHLNNGLTYLNGSNSDPSSGYASIAAAPVPENDTYAMLLLGLGMMKIMMRRRQNTKI